MVGTGGDAAPEVIEVPAVRAPWSDVPDMDAANGPDRVLRAVLLQPGSGASASSPSPVAPRALVVAASPQRAAAAKARLAAGGCPSRRVSLMLEVCFANLSAAKAGSAAPGAAALLRLRRSYRAFVDQLQQQLSLPLGERSASVRSPGLLREAFLSESPLSGPVAGSLLAGGPPGAGPSQPVFQVCAGALAGRPFGASPAAALGFPLAIDDAPAAAVSLCPGAMLPGPVASAPRAFAPGLVLLQEPEKRPRLPDPTDSGSPCKRIRPASSSGPEQAGQVADLCAPCRASGLLLRHTPAGGPVGVEPRAASFWQSAASVLREPSSSAHVLLSQQLLVEGLSQFQLTRRRLGLDCAAVVGAGVPASGPGSPGPVDTPQGRPISEAIFLPELHGAPSLPSLEHMRPARTAHLPYRAADFSLSGSRPMVERTASIMHAQHAKRLLTDIIELEAVLPSLASGDSAAKRVPSLSKMLASVDAARLLCANTAEGMMPSLDAAASAVSPAPEPDILAQLGQVASAAPQTAVHLDAATARAHITRAVSAVFSSVGFSHLSGRALDATTEVLEEYLGRAARLVSASLASAGALLLENPDLSLAQMSMDSEFFHHVARQLGLSRGFSPASVAAEADFTQDITYSRSLILGELQRRLDNLPEDQLKLARTLATEEAAAGVPSHSGDPLKVDSADAPPAAAADPASQAKEQQHSGESTGPAPGAGHAQLLRRLQHIQKTVARAADNRAAAVAARAAIHAEAMAAATAASTSPSTQASRSSTPVPVGSVAAATAAGASASAALPAPANPSGLKLKVGAGRVSKVLPSGGVPVSGSGPSRVRPVAAGAGIGAGGTVGSSDPGDPPPGAKAAPGGASTGRPAVGAGVTGTAPPVKGAKRGSTPGAGGSAGAESSTKPAPGGASGVTPIGRPAKKAGSAKPTAPGRKMSTGGTKAAGSAGPAGRAAAGAPGTGSSKAGIAAGTGPGTSAPGPGPGPVSLPTVPRSVGAVAGKRLPTTAGSAAAEAAPPRKVGAALPRAPGGRKASSSASVPAAARGGVAKAKVAAAAAAAAAAAGATGQSRVSKSPATAKPPA